jgi:hypothetical protein
LAEAALPRGLRKARADELPSEAVAALYDEPGAGIEVLVEQLTAYWEVAIAPYWGWIRALLEGDLLYRARRLAQGGPAGLFEDLDSSVRWKQGALRIKHRRFHGVRELAGEGVLLMPSAFVWPSVYWSTIPPWQPSVTYPRVGWRGSGRRRYGVRRLGWLECWGGLGLRCLCSWTCRGRRPSWRSGSG